MSQDEVCGFIERITFQNVENGYTVAKIQQPRQRELTCIVGTMPEVQPGETIRCFGEWKVHLVHGRQFQVERYRTEAPADVEGIKKYLGSGLIKGIGPVYAERITAQFGAETLHVIDQTPELLKKIPGIGKKRIDKIKTCWQEQKTIRDLMIFLQSYGISPTHAQRIFRTYGDESVSIIQDNPYHLARDIFRIGFKTADAMAEKIGIEKDAPQRIVAGIEYVLHQLANNGHVCYPLEDFLQEAQSLLAVDARQIRELLETLEKEDRIKIADIPETFIWLKKLFLAEQGVARELWRIKKSPGHLRKIDVEKAVAWVQEKLRIELADKQKTAVAKALSEKVQIITGGPGTGKSTITNAILTITGKLTNRIVLAAPTGRAAKRMSEITGRPAKTIHSLLEFDFRVGGFKRNRDNPLDCDVIIVDEASMIDTALMHSLLKAIPAHARLILVGDIHQLPSVGPGNVLKDIIESYTMPVTRLNEIFRQAAGSHIITNAHRINRGVFPDISNDPSSDFFFIEQEDPEKILEEIVTLVSRRLPQKYRLDSIHDIQVLAPMKRGVIGIDHLNTILQQELNRRDQAIMRAGCRFVQGDKVMQIRNNYQKEVFNGDVGIIQKMDPVEQQVTVQYDEKMVEYDYGDLDEVVLAYAVSIHKYQGSECPCVIIPVHTTHFMMLRRNLLYTGVTRGKKWVIVIGSKKGIELAVNNDDVKTRHTALKQALGSVTE